MSGSISKRQVEAMWDEWSPQCRKEEFVKLYTFVFGFAASVLPKVEMHGAVEILLTQNNEVLIKEA